MVKINPVKYYKNNNKLPENINNLSDRIICKLLELNLDFVNDLKTSRINFTIAKKLLELDIEEFIILIDYVIQDNNLYNEIVCKYIDKTGKLPENLQFKILKSENKCKIIKMYPSYINELYDSERNYTYFKTCLRFTDKQILDNISCFSISSYKDYNLSLLICNNHDYFKKLSLEIKKNINIDALATSSLDCSKLTEEDKNIILDKLNNASSNTFKKMYNKRFLEFLDEEKKSNFKIKWYKKSNSIEDKIKILENFKEDEFEVLLKYDLSSIMYAPKKFITNERWLNAFEYVMKKPFKETNSYFWKNFPVEILDKEKIYRIIDTHIHALDYIELESLDDDKYWEIIEKNGYIKDTHVKLFKEKFKPEKLDIVLRCFEVSPLLASYKPLLNEINEDNIGIFITICPEAIEYLPLNQKLVYSLCLYDPNFVRFFFTDKYITYLDNLLLELFIAKANNVKITEIPKDYLTEDLILLSSQRSNTKIFKLNNQEKTPIRLDIEENKKIKF